VYAAESEVLAGRHFTSAAQVRACVETVVASPWWQASGWPAHVAVRITSTRQRGCVASGGRVATRAGWRYFVRFPSWESIDAELRAMTGLETGTIDRDDWPWAWHDVVIAHELAHVSLLADPVTYDRGHGPVFCRRHLEIVRTISGDEAAAELTARWDAHGVAWYPPLDWDGSVAGKVGDAVSGPVLVAG
jgi:hypothetical protein